MLLLSLIVVAVLAFGHGGYQRGYYFRDPYYAPPPSAGFGGSFLGIIAVLFVLWLFFGHHHSYARY